MHLIINSPHTYTNAHGSVTVYESGYDVLDGVPCRYVRASGEPGLFFGDAAEIYRFEEGAGGVWRAWWVSTDPELRLLEQEAARLYAARSNK